MQLPFVAETLRALKTEVGDAATTLGFIGAPWTLAAYAVEGRAERWALRLHLSPRRDSKILYNIELYNIKYYNIKTI